MTCNNQKCPHLRCKLWNRQLYFIEHFNLRILFYLPAHHAVTLMGWRSREAQNSARRLGLSALASTLTSRPSREATCSSQPWRGGPQRILLTAVLSCRWIGYYRCLSNPSSNGKGTNDQRRWKNSFIRQISSENTSRSNLGIHKYLLG